MSGAVLVRNGDTLEVNISACRGADFQDALAKIKDIPGRKFDGDRKLWLLPAEPLVAERAVAMLRPDVDSSLMDWIREERSSAAQELTTIIPKDAELLIPWSAERQSWQPTHVNDEEFNGLFDYQRAAVDVLVKAQRAILADDMGLGKTLQAISVVEEFKLRNEPQDAPKLVVSPNNVKGAWKRELTRWLENAPLQIIDGTTLKSRHNQLEKAIHDKLWCIINWEQLRVKKEKVKLKNGGRRINTVMKEPLLDHAPWLAVIADEVHRAKNRKSLQTQGLWRVQAPLMLGLSGTPLMNSPDELWSVLRWLHPQEYTSYWRFFEQYVDYYEEPYRGKVITGVKNPDALRFELKGRLIRRTSGQVRPDKPGKRRIYYDVPLGKQQRKLYDEAVKAMWLQVEADVAAGKGDAMKFAAAADQASELATKIERAAEKRDWATVDRLTVEFERAKTILYRIPNGAARLVRLQQIIESPALLGAENDSALLDDLDQKFADSRPEPWLVFTKFKMTNNLVAERLRTKYDAEVGIYNGDVTDPAERTELEDAFQRGELDCLVGTIEALREGITLTHGHLQHWFTRHWTPDWNEQGESRQADRIGQKDKTMIYIPQAALTIAVSKIEPTNRLKEHIVRTVLPKDSIEEVTL